MNELTMANPAPAYPVADIEKGVISALLTSPGLLPDVTGWLTPEMFSSQDMRFIYESVCRQYDQGNEPDYLTTEAEMRRTDEARTTRMGGIAALDNAILNIRHGGNVVPYAEEVKRQYLLRRLNASGQSTLDRSARVETDPLELIGQVEQEMLTLREAGNGGETSAGVGSLLGVALEVHRQRKEKGVEAFGVVSGLRELDSIFGGLQPGELFILGGRPGDGKTAIALHIASHAAQQNKHTCFFSLEMTNQQLMNRLFTAHTNVSSKRLRASQLSEPDLLALDNFARSWENVPLYINYTPAQTVENIRSQVLLMKKKQQCDFVVIDYLQLMNTTSQRNETQDLYIGRIVKAVKRLAKEADIPILLLSQMNRDVERRTDKAHLPILSDLRDSGAIEQDADGVFFVYRPERYGMDADPKTGDSYRNVLLLIVRKNRNNDVGTARIQHNNSFTRFYDYSGGVIDFTE